MSIGFFIFGATIFALYMYFTFWNIIYSNKKQREENYPSLGSEGYDLASSPTKRVVRRPVKVKKTIYVGTKAKITNL